MFKNIKERMNKFMIKYRKFAHKKGNPIGAVLRWGKNAEMEEFMEPVIIENDKRFQDVVTAHGFYSVKMLYEEFLYNKEKGIIPSNAEFSCAYVYWARSRIAEIGRLDVNWIYSQAQKGYTNWGCKTIEEYTINKERRTKDYNKLILEESELNTKLMFIEIRDENTGELLRYQYNFEADDFDILKSKDAQLIVDNPYNVKKESKIDLEKDKKEIKEKESEINSKKNIKKSIKKNNKVNKKE